MNIFPKRTRPFAFDYVASFSTDKNDGWNVYDPEEEFNRQNIFANGWRITKVLLNKSKRVFY